MKPQARVQSAIEILEQSHLARVPLDKVVGDYMRGRRYIGSKDRKAIAEYVYDMTRAHARLGWWVEQYKMDDTPRTRMIAFLILRTGADAKRFKDLFDGSQYAPEALDAEEQKFASALHGKPLTHDDMPAEVKVECPPAHADALKAYFGDDFEAEMTAMMQGATLDMRVNTIALEREQAQNSLAKDGVETELTQYSPWGLRALDKAYLSKTKAFSKGHVSIQDEGSQMIALVCDAQPGMQVIDYCAGGGGKTLALGNSMNKKGRIVAMDMDARRLERGRNRYKKAGIADMIEVRPLSEKRHVKWLKRQSEKFDVVLCDVPCSGTGTWRRNPDTRWKQLGITLPELVAVQEDILERVAHVVKLGGRLVYATCSLLPVENEERIETFLKAHPEFKLLPASEALGKDIEDMNIGNPYMRLTPHRHKTDGFFAAVMVKTKADDTIVKRTRD